MPTGTLILFAVAACMAAAAFRRGGDMGRQGLHLAARRFVEVVPRALLALVAASFVTQLVPGGLVAQWLGPDTQLLGIVSGAAVGALIPGGPVLAFPLAAFLDQAGAGTPQLVALITAWSIFAIHRILAYETPLVGWRFTVTRLVASSPVPIATGVLAGLAVGMGIS